MRGLHTIRLGVCLPPAKSVFLYFADASGLKEETLLTPEQARETARGLILMADLSEDLRTRDPRNGRFRKHG